MPRLDVAAAIRAFRELTGRAPTEPEMHDAWKVFVEAVKAAIDPTPERAAWLAKSSKPWKASAGLLKSRLRPALEAYETAFDDEGNVLEALNRASLESVRQFMSQFDRAFEKLTAAQVERANNARGQYMRLALLALPVEAMGVKLKKRETEAHALRRIANAFREAERKRREASQKQGARKKSTKRTA